MSASMIQIRTWLDHNRFEPDIFRLSYFTFDVIFQVAFKFEREAEAFAEAFDGKILAEPARTD